MQVFPQRVEDHTAHRSSFMYKEQQKKTWTWIHSNYAVCQQVSAYPTYDQFGVVNYLFFPNESRYVPKIPSMYGILFT